tara:strand:+ start:1666 stop:2145 length:480 start_codon:yes stop_codon:yes gene_type:complete
MDINPSKIAEMMELLDEHQEHMPEGTRLVLCNKLLECKQEERIEYEITLVYPTVRYEIVSCGEYQTRMEMSMPITIIKSFTQAEFNNFENSMQHKKYGSVSNLQGNGTFNQIMDISRSINYEIDKLIGTVNDFRDAEEFRPLEDIKVTEMMIVDYQRRI